MPIIISFILLVLTGAYLLVRSDLPFVVNVDALERVHDLIQKSALMFDGIFLGVALLAFAVSFITIFFIRNSSLVIGSKNFLLLFSVLSLVLVAVLGYYVFRHLEPTIQNFLGETYTAEAPS